MKKPTIPQIRERLSNLADSLDQIEGELRWLANATRRTVTKEKTATRSKKCGPGMRRMIVAEYRRNPKRSVQQLANMFGVNPGRVSEAIKMFKGK